MAEINVKQLRTVRIGFMPLTDCASLVMAAECGFDRQYGIRIVLSRETSWANVRDKLGSGALDAAHVLYGLMYGVQLGIGCQQQAMAVLMNLSRNGQAVTLSRALAEQGVVDGPSLARRMREAPRVYTFAHTFPTGNHAMLLYYWLAAHGIDPLRHARALTVPPAQMVGSLRAGMIDGFCAGEPWGQRAIDDGVGVTAVTSQRIWPDHPGKVLGTTAAFAGSDPGTCRAMIAAVLDASRWIEASKANKEQTATVLARSAYLNTGREAIEARLMGQYDNGAGSQWMDEKALSFHGDGEVNFPYLSDGMWFMTQQRRWGLLRDEPDYLGQAQAVNRIDLYRGAAEMTGTSVPSSPMRSSTLIDGVEWDGSDPQGYAQSFRIHPG
ncbi:CmpA/NrtA family ABC transporter substrate-binding protein [Massilia pseudoviolaceinigra]|uniref:CmpA/NrtA family ABC transporter substrate-binding protein n=1 Tax=Massilia pseudoviolaceinigra TaxID=3057165 RepID=UPI0027965E54|nr:CmpA/NrtA family ABC transporter substrate-binding protein [Massilia sp. CCM 9206]MDQ1921753.1 CmpA/NrtA family ABC transporter substrate-binding protein [Massilia sp. CCM 9206]